AMTSSRPATRRTRASGVSPTAAWGSDRPRCGQLLDSSRSSAPPFRDLDIDRESRLTQFFHLSYPLTPPAPRCSLNSPLRGGLPQSRGVGCAATLPHGLSSPSRRSLLR